MTSQQTESTKFLRSHQYEWLAERWQRLAAREGWKIWDFAEAGGYPAMAILHEGGEEQARMDLYLSAGIHGDEPAATEGMFAWVERRRVMLRRMNFLFFPCLNPWGLVNNSRVNEAGLDLNRCYRRDDVPMIAAQKNVVGAREFDVAVMLHEDFDAQGVYLYEIAGGRPYWGEALLAAAARHLPCESRKHVEGRRCRGGLIRTRITPESLPDHPEAFFLRFGHTKRSLTIETPSEFSMTARVQTHMEILEEVVRRQRAGKA